MWQSGQKSTNFWFPWRFVFFLFSFACKSAESKHRRRGRHDGSQVILSFLPIWLQAGRSYKLFHRAGTSRCHMLLAMQWLHCKNDSKKLEKWIRVKNKEKVVLTPFPHQSRVTRISELQLKKTNFPWRKACWKQQMCTSLGVCACALRSSEQQPAEQIFSKTWVDVWVDLSGF